MTTSTSLSNYLEFLDRRWNPPEQLLLGPAISPGYHTRIPPTAQAHSTKLSMDYAIACFMSGHTWRFQRANEIISRILDLQVTDPLDQHFGIWGWFMEEPPRNMAPADWNWADFMCVRLAQILIRHGSLLLTDLRERVYRSLRLSAWSIFRRNCGLAYTNIAIMGGVACAAAGELLDDRLLLEYGRTRLQGVVKLVHECGGFSEYNSPTYTRVALEEAERALMLIRDQATRDAAEELRVIAWRTLAEHFHPATAQIAGPQGRAYCDHVLPELAEYLATQTGAPIRSRFGEPGPDTEWDLARTIPNLVTPLPCPPAIAKRFHALPTIPFETRHRYSANRYIDTVGTSWFSEEACLGSVTRGLAWVQQRPILGYWRTREDPSICVRVRVLKDGRDFSSAYLWSSQAGPRILTSVSIISDAGDHHIVLDKPADARFHFRELTVRVQVTGRGVTGAKLDAGRFSLSTGGHTLFVHTAPSCQFEGRPISWNLVSESESVSAEATLYRGDERVLNARSTELRLAFALELLGSSSLPSTEPITFTELADPVAVNWRWNGLEVLGRTVPVAFAW
jgi:hypothetical protein